MSRGKWTFDPVTELHPNDLDEIPGIDHDDVHNSLRALAIMSGKNVFAARSLANAIGVTVRHFTRNITKNPNNPYRLSSLQIIRDDRKTTTTLWGGNEEFIRSMVLQPRKLRLCRIT